MWRRRRQRVGIDKEAMLAAAFYQLQTVAACVPLKPVCDVCMRSCVFCCVDMCLTDDDVFVCVSVCLCCEHWGAPARACGFSLSLSAFAFSLQCVVSFVRLVAKKINARYKRFAVVSTAFQKLVIVCLCVCLLQWALTEWWCKFLFQVGCVWCDWMMEEKENETLLLSLQQTRCACNNCMQHTLQYPRNYIDGISYVVLMWRYSGAC